jgi:hypothetical protein
VQMDKDEVGRLMDRLDARKAEANVKGERAEMTVEETFALLDACLLDWLKAREAGDSERERLAEEDLRSFFRHLVAADAKDGLPPRLSAEEIDTLPIEKLHATRLAHLLSPSKTTS